MKVSFTQEQFNLVLDLLSKHYNHITTHWEETDPDATMIAYGAIYSMQSVRD